MKKNIFKALTTITLALALVVSAVPNTVFAAADFGDCDHALQTETRGFSHYESANSQMHWVMWYCRSECDDCYAETDYYEYVYDYLSHDLSEYVNGNWGCIDCDYEEAPGTR